MGVMSENTLTPEQKQAGIVANKRGFITHLIASGKTEEQAAAMYKKASATESRRSKLAESILEARKK